MKFEFDTTTDGEKEATALVTLLAILHGPAISDTLDRTLNNFDASIAADKLAADGHPFNVADHANRKSVDMEDEPSAADAFGTESPTPAPSTAAATGPVDSAGIPWDERIHSGSKGTNKDGTWSRRRNTPDATFDAVMAELKGGTPNPPAPTTAAPPPPPPPPAPTESAPAASVAPITNAPDAASSAPKGISFPLLMVKITKAQAAGTIDKATVDSFLGAFDMKDVKELARAPKETVEAINEMVDGHVGA